MAGASTPRARHTPLTEQELAVLGEYVFDCGHTQALSTSLEDLFGRRREAAGYAWCRTCDGCRLVTGRADASGGDLLGAIARRGLPLLVSGGFMVVFVAHFAETTIRLAWCWLCVMGALLTIVDIEERRLPTRMVTALAGGGVALLTFSAATENNWARLGSAAAAAVATFLLAFTIQLVAPGHTGGGDTKLYAALALYLGWWGWTGLVMGLLCATALTALVALAVLLRDGGHLNTRFPAGPTLILGAALGVLIA